MTGMYDQGFYDVIRQGAQCSARTAVPIIADAIGLTANHTVLDVGCGEGWWADAFARHGCRVTGLDSGHTAHRPDTFEFVEHPLDEPLPDGHWDLIVCLEVAEHLARNTAARLIREMTLRASCILFSAARPGQGGTGHVNEQPIGYWADRFYVNDWAASGALRWRLWGRDEIENWYQQNLLVAVPRVLDVDNGPFLGDLLFPPHVPTEMAAPHDVVHPILFDARRRP